MEITSVRRSLSIRGMNGPDRCFPLCRAIIEKYRERESSLFSFLIQRERFTEERNGDFRQQISEETLNFNAYWKILPPKLIFSSSCNKAGKRETERNKKVSERARAHDKRCDINAVSR